jgi:2-dehydropantoate 2-reductase
VRLLDNSAQDKAMDKAMDKIVIAGAGSIGCYVGAALADAGRNVTFLVRPARAAHISTQGIRVSDLDSRNRLVAPSQFTLETDPHAAFDQATLILVCVKRGDTAGIGSTIAQFAPEQAAVLSLQNGVGNEDVLAPLVAPRAALPGVVMFNAVLDDSDPLKPITVHRATSGGIYMPTGNETIRASLNAPGLDTVARPDMRAVAWGKLLLNLNNALNALSDLPLRQQLSSRPWRLLLADQVIEALRVLKAANITPAKVGAVKPALIPHILRLPDLAFQLAAARMLAIDAGARSSMWEDLDRRRTTEIDHLQGAIQTLAHAHHVAAPLTAHLTALIKSAEAAGAGSPALTATQIRSGLQS